MNVRELIEVLVRCPKDLPVCFDDMHDTYAAREISEWQVEVIEEQQYDSPAGESREGKVVLIGRFGAPRPS